MQGLQLHCSQLPEFGKSKAGSLSKRENWVRRESGKSKGGGQTVDLVDRLEGKRRPSGKKRKGGNSEEK